MVTSAVKYEKLGKEDKDTNVNTSTSTKSIKGIVNIPLIAETENG